MQESSPRIAAREPEPTPIAAPAPAAPAEPKAKIAELLGPLWRAEALEQLRVQSFRVGIPMFTAFGVYSVFRVFGCWDRFRPPESGLTFGVSAVLGLPYKL